MRLILAIVIFSASLYLAYFAYAEGVSNAECGCQCPSNAQMIPTMPMIYLQKEHKTIQPLDFKNCDIPGVGGAPRVPLFIDLLGGAGILFLFGLVVLFRNESSLLK